MQIKKIVVVGVATCLSMSIAAAQSVVPLSLWQRDSCAVDGVPTSDVNLLDGAPKTVNCVWRSGDAGIQMTLHAGQVQNVEASCKFTRGENSNDVLGSVDGRKAATVKNLDLSSDPITFTVENDLSDTNLDIQFLLNPGSKIDKLSRWVTWTHTTDIAYTVGDSISCTFTPLALVKR